VIVGGGGPVVMGFVGSVFWDMLRRFCDDGVCWQWFFGCAFIGEEK